MAKAKKLPSGSYNVLAYSHTEPNGKRIYESFTSSTPEEAEFLAAKFKFEKKQGKHKKKNKLEITLGEAIDKYIACKDGVLSPSTIQGYKKIRNFSLQKLMNFKLKDLTQEILQEAVNLESKKISPRTGKKLSPKTISNAYNLISAAILMFDPNFNANIGLPSRNKNIIELPTAEMVLDTIIGSDIELPCLLAAWLSYSMSEIRGIKISAISNDGIITIKNSIVDIGGKPVEKDTMKAYERTRKTELPPYLFSLVKSQETYKRAKETGNDEYLIPWRSNRIYKRFIALQKESGLPHMTFHNLRHLNASIMLLLGVPDKYAMERGGWATPYTMKNIYQHTFSKERKIVDDKINSYFNNLLEKQNAKRNAKQDIENA